MLLDVTCAIKYVGPLQKGLFGPLKVPGNSGSPAAWSLFVERDTLSPGFDWGPWAGPVVVRAVSTAPSWAALVGQGPAGTGPRAAEQETQKQPNLFDEAPSTRIPPGTAGFAKGPCSAHCRFSSEPSDLAAAGPTRSVFCTDGKHLVTHVPNRPPANYCTDPLPLRTFRITNALTSPLLHLPKPLCRSHLSRFAVLMDGHCEVLHRQGHLSGGSGPPLQMKHIILSAAPHLRRFCSAIKRSLAHPNFGASRAFTLKIMGAQCTPP